MISFSDLWDLVFHPLSALQETLRFAVFIAVAWAFIWAGRGIVKLFKL